MICEKIPYVSRREAVQAGSGLVREKGGKAKPYCCPNCGFWHLTSRRELKPSERRAGRRLGRKASDQVGKKRKGREFG